MTNQWTQEIERQSLEPGSLRTGQIIIRDQDGEFICKVHHSKANLVAAAPELLGACKAVLRDLDKPWSPITKAHFGELLETAIAEAEGRS